MDDDDDEDDLQSILAVRHARHGWIHGVTDGEMRMPQQVKNVHIEDIDRPVV
jgi:hypothetical protein